MKSFLSAMPMGRSGRLLLLASLILPALAIYTIWYSMNSDKDNIPAFLLQVIPAGHATCEKATIFQCSSCLEQNWATNRNDTDIWSYQYGRDDRNEGLSESQCQVAFPGLFEDIHQGTNYWQHRRQTTIAPRMLDRIDVKHGMTRAMIFNGDLYIIQSRSMGEDHRRKTLAALSSMYRALSATGDRRSLPNIEFVFSVEDKATDVTSIKTEPLWVLARKASEQSFFLLPDFGLWVSS